MIEIFLTLSDEFFTHFLMLRSYLYIILSAILFGFIGVLVKLIGGNVPAMTLNFFRIFIGFLFLLVVVPLLDPSVFRVPKNELKEYAIVGLCYAVSFSCFVTSMYYIPIQNAILITALAPFIILALASFFLREQLTRTKIITAVIAFVGLVIMNPFQADYHFYGTLLSVVSAFFYSLMVVGMRRESKVHGIRDVLWFFFFATLLLLPFPFVYGLGDIQPVIFYVLVLGLFSTGLAYLFFNLALKRLEAGTSSIIVNVITPLIAIGLAVLVVQEELNFQIILGGSLLILAGVYLEMHDLQLRKSLQRQKQENLD